MNRSELLLTLLHESVEECYRNDFTLIEHSMEQACVARIFYYMQKALKQDRRFDSFSRYNLDCEYNKNYAQIKETPRCPNGTRPDIILHRRLSNDSNKLVVEFKSRRGRNKKDLSSGQSIDIIKLEDFTKQGVYRYFLGVYVKLMKRGARYTYFQNGRETPREKLRE